MFYLTYSIINSEMHYSNTESDTVGKFTHVPTVAIITKVSIDRRHIVYTLTEYSQGDNKIIKRSIEKPEEEVDNLMPSITKLMDLLSNIYFMTFQNLAKEVNKEKLSDVLSGGE